MFNHFSYVPHRRLLYFLIWVIAAIELGLTAARIHYTRSNFSTHDPIVAELLTTSILTLLWVPLTFLFHQRSPGIGGNTSAGPAGPFTRHGRLGGLHNESLGGLLLWLMWLVGAAIATHHWPNRLAVGSGLHATILLTIVAFSWLAFGLLTLVGMLTLMEYSAVGALGSVEAGAQGGALGREKAVPGSNADTNTNTARVPNIGYNPHAQGTTTAPAPVTATV